MGTIPGFALEKRLTYRPYNPETDYDAAVRIWTEVGWIEPDEAEVMKWVPDSGRADVAELNGEAECLVVTSPGDMQYLDTRLSTCFVAGVTTSRIARKQRFAGELTARCIARDVADGAALSALGMFEQGYYNRLGFGAGPYVVHLMIDPAEVPLPPARRVPVRLAPDDWEEVHACRLRRMRCHGSVNITPPAMTRFDLKCSKNGFGLGYRDGEDGALSHHAWFSVPDDVEHGPYVVWWLAYENDDQLRELFGLVRNLGDQVHRVRLNEPPRVQLQDLMAGPMKQRRLTRHTPRASDTYTIAYWQMRICDLAECVSACSVPGGPVRFNLAVTDPIEAYLPDEAPWRGTAGSYIVEFGPTSGAEPGRDETLPTMRASINAFTRLWLGVRPASGLALTDELHAPAELLDELDRTLRLPPPQTDWDF